MWLSWVSGLWTMNIICDLVGRWQIPMKNIFIKEDPQVVNGQQFDLGVWMATPKIGSIVLYIMGFETINIVGLDPTKAKVGDLVVRIDLIMAFKLEFKCGWKCIMAIKLGE